MTIKKDEEELEKDEKKLKEMREKAKESRREGAMWKRQVEAVGLGVGPSAIRCQAPGSSRLWLLAGVQAKCLTLESINLRFWVCFESWIFPG